MAFFPMGIKEPGEGGAGMEELVQDRAWISGLLLWVQEHGQLCQYVTEVNTDKQEMPLFYPGS